MDKRFIAAVGLSILILLGWQYLFPPPKPEPRPQPAAQTTAEPAGPAQATVPEPNRAEPTPSGPTVEATDPVAAASDEEVRVETEHFDVTLTNRGGRVLSWKLKGFTSSSDGAVEMVPAAARRADRLPLALDVAGDDLDRELNGALYRVERSTVSPDDARGPAERVRFVWADGRGLEVEKVLEFRQKDYLVDVAVHATDRGRNLEPRLVWGPGFEADDSIASGVPLSGSHYVGQAVIDRPGTLAQRFPRQKVKHDIEIPEGTPMDWAGLEETYFAALIIPAGSGPGAIIRSQSIPAGSSSDKPDDKSSHPDEVTVAVGLPEGTAQIYVGPKKYSILHGLGHDLDRVVWFASSGFMYVLAKWLFLALLWLHDHVLPNYGVSIILATVALRAGFFPLNQYSMVKMRKTSAQMQKIQPKIKAIQAKYKKSKDAQARVKMNQETMDLYKREGVNPFGGMSGCLPMLVQLPVLYAFYNVLVVAVELRGAPFFGWIHDLTLKDPFYVTPILMGVSMLVQQTMTPTAGVDPTQRRMMMILPVVFTVMFINLPSGLVLYWLVNNVLGIGQQWLVNRHVAKLESTATAKA